MTELQTPRLILKSCSSRTLEAAIKGEGALARLLNITIAEGWTEFGHPPLLYALDKLRYSEEERGWWTWLPILKEDRVLLGTCGYKGKPGHDLAVEIGYEVAPAYRNKGIATEIAHALIDNAICSGCVNKVVAHTLPEKNASARVLEKCGLRWIKEINDPEDGIIWRWEMDKNSQVQQ